MPIRSARSPPTSGSRSWWTATRAFTACWQSPACRDGCRRAQEPNRPTTSLALFPGKSRSAQGRLRRRTGEVQHRRGREQRLGVVMLGMIEYVVTQALLDDLAALHHHDAVGD